MSNLKAAIGQAGAGAILKNMVMGDLGIQQQEFHIVIQQNNGAGQEKPKDRIEQADLSLEVILQA